MSKKILVTGSTDGIGLETAKKLLLLGHQVLIHGRNSEKIKACEQELSKIGEVESYQADLADMSQVAKLSEEFHLPRWHLSRIGLGTFSALGCNRGWNPGQGWNVAGMRLEPAC